MNVIAATIRRMAITKQRGSSALLDTEIDAPLDRTGLVAAIVLRGSAEGHIPGLLEFADQVDEASRAVATLHRRLVGHADREREPLQPERDLHVEARVVRYQAADNGYSVTGAAAPR